MERIAIVSSAGETRAEFAPEAHLVCTSLRHRDTEYLYAGGGLDAYAERGKTMGIPLLYPWANRLAAPDYEVAGRRVELGPADGRYPVDPAGLPIHGALPGALRWEVREHDRDRLRARLSWTGESLLSLFPFSHSVEVEARVDERGLTLATTVHADAGDPVPVSFGYHPYLMLPDSDRAGWQVDLGAREHLELDAAMIPTGSRTTLRERDFLLAGRSLDDGLAGLATPAQFLVSDGERTVSAAFETGYDWAQVYAPDGQDFICFEPMTAPTNALRSGEGLVVLAPGESHRARVAFTMLP